MQSFHKMWCEKEGTGLTRCAECGFDLTREACVACKVTFDGRKIIVCTSNAHLCLNCYSDAKLTEVTE